jgi:cell wall-associated NlpC family hydrolase
MLSEQKLSAPDNEEEVGDAEEAMDEQVAEKNEERQEGSEPPATWSNPEERSLLVRLVKTFLGAPYRLGGTTLKGLDCSAFVRKIYEVFNIHLPRTTREQLSIGKRVTKEELKEGDLVFFKTGASRANNAHVGIYIGNNEFVHASSRKREVKVDNLNAPYFSSHFLRGVRVKEPGRDLKL